MLEFAVQLTTASALALGLFYLYLARALTYPGGVPRVGPPGVRGYITTALRYVLHAADILREGKSQFDGRPFAIPTLSGYIFYLGPEYLERIRTSTDDMFNAQLSMEEGLQLKHTMNAAQMQNPYQAAVARTDVTRAVPSFIPEVAEEAALTLDHALHSQDGKASASVPVFEAMAHAVARISNRVIFGVELCRNEGFIHAIVRFAETIPVMAPPLRWTPRMLRPLGQGGIFHTVADPRGKREAYRYIVPYMQEFLKKRETMEHDQNTFAEFMTKAAPPGETAKGLAMRLMNLNFGAIHTSTIFITQALYELVLLPKADIEGIRAEIRYALESEGGEWNKAALQKCRQIDSMLKEVGRVYGLMFSEPLILWTVVVVIMPRLAALGRVAMQGVDLGDGTSIPPGMIIGMDIQAIHFDPKIYPDPERFDAFRFSRLRENQAVDTKYGFSTINAEYLPFGMGRHACPGRFFAAMELKIMLAHILLNYDFALPPGQTERPKTFEMNGGIVPDPKAHLIFTRRAA
ncbi:cytochrome P450 [Infundibulicybe gibba]|nr:cytochrome P450 [Infundibulicybe gibba]